MQIENPTTKLTLTSSCTGDNEKTLLIHLFQAMELCPSFINQPFEYLKI